MGKWIAAILIATSSFLGHAQVDGTFNNLQTKTTPLVDVRSYGAIANGTYDNTAAFQAAVTAASAVGGIVYVPPIGVFAINGPINSACDAIVCLPSVASTSQTEQVKIIGATRDRQDSQGPATTAGSVITTTTSTGTDLNSTIFGVPNVPGNFGGLDNVEFYASDLTIRTYPNPKIGCLSGWNASGAAFDQIRCEVGESYDPPTHTQPTFVVAGIQLPQVNNDTLSRLTWSEITGYYVGIVASEHAHFQGTWVAFGIQGLSLQPGYYPVSGKIGMEEVATPIFVNGALTADLELGVEIDPANTWGCAAWCYSATDISDVSNRLKGMIHYTKVQAGTGNIATPLSLLGGLNLSTYNDYTQIATNNASPRTQVTVGVNPTANADGLEVGTATEYGDVDMVLGNWNSVATGEAQAGVMQVYNGGSGNTLGTTHYNLFIQPFGGNTTIGNGGAPLNLLGNSRQWNGNAIQDWTLSSGICTTAAAAYAACSFTVTLPTAYGDNNYSVQATQGPVTGVITALRVISETTTGFTVQLQNGGSSAAVASTLTSISFHAAHN